MRTDGCDTAENEYNIKWKRSIAGCTEKESVI